MREALQTCQDHRMLRLGAISRHAASNDVRLRKAGALGESNARCLGRVQRVRHLAALLCQCGRGMGLPALQHEVPRSGSRITPYATARRGVSNIDVGQERVHSCRALTSR